MVLNGAALDRELTFFSAAAAGQLGLSVSTVVNYLYALARFFDWLEQDAIAKRENWGRFEDPRLIRAATERRIITKHSCKLRRHRDHEGPGGCFITPSNATDSLIIEIQALRAYYEL